MGQSLTVFSDSVPSVSLWFDYGFYSIQPANSVISFA